MNLKAYIQYYYKFSFGTRMLINYFLTGNKKKSYCKDHQSLVKFYNLNVYVKIFFNIEFT